MKSKYIGLFCLIVFFGCNEESVVGASEEEEVGNVVVADSLKFATVALEGEFYLFLMGM